MGRHDVFAAALVAAAVTACSPAQRPVPTPATETERRYAGFPEDRTRAPRLRDGLELLRLHFAPEPQRRRIAGRCAASPPGSGLALQPGPRSNRLATGPWKSFAPWFAPAHGSTKSWAGFRSRSTTSATSAADRSPIIAHTKAAATSTCSSTSWAPTASPSRAWGRSSIQTAWGSTFETWPTRVTTSSCSSIWLGLGFFFERSSRTEEAQLQQIFVAEHLRTLLLEYARSNGEPSTTVTRFAAMSCQPSYPHDDHFHFRFFCAPDDIVEGCRDSAPLYPWHRKRLERAARAIAPAGVQTSERECTRS